MRQIKLYSKIPKYGVGDDGTIWSYNYNHTGKLKQMKTYPDKDGYRYVFLVVDSKRIKKRVHRMVAEEFCLNLFDWVIVNHKNGVRDDNRADNLEWCTQQQNCIHAYRSNGRKHSDKQIANGKERFGGSNNPKAKINEATVLSIRRLRAKGDSLKDIAERHGISKSQVSAIANGKSWQSPSLLTNQKKG